MQILYKIGADITVLVHLGWVLFLIFGMFLGWWWKSVMWLHLGGLAFSVVLQVFSGICPLTHLEVWLRARHDPELVYPGSFIAHYAETWVYLQVQPGGVLAATLIVVSASLTVYLYRWWGRGLRRGPLR
jgi:hypothetical protein